MFKLIPPKVWTSFRRGILLLCRSGAQCLIPILEFRLKYNCRSGAQYLIQIPDFRLKYDCRSRAQCLIPILDFRLKYNCRSGAQCLIQIPDFRLKYDWACCNNNHLLLRVSFRKTPFIAIKHRVSALKQILILTTQGN